MPDRGASLAVVQPTEPGLQEPSQLLEGPAACLLQGRCVVGDSDQSVYSFRAADIRNILEFEEAFPDATVWSDFGMGYLFIPVLLPVTAVFWLRKSRAHTRPAEPSGA